MVQGGETLVCPNNVPLTAPRRRNPNPSNHLDRGAPVGQFLIIIPDSRRNVRFTVPPQLGVHRASPRSFTCCVGSLKRSSPPRCVNTQAGLTTKALYLAKEHLMADRHSNCRPRVSAVVSRIRFAGPFCATGAGCPSNKTQHLRAGTLDADTIKFSRKDQNDGRNQRDNLEAEA